MSRENPLWGAPRILSELLLLGHQVAERTVAKYMVRIRKPPSQTWRTFLANHVPDIAACDFFTVPTATFRVLYVFLILRHDRRQVVHFNVTEHPYAEWAAQQVVNAFPYDETSKVPPPGSGRHLQRVFPDSRRRHGHRGSPYGSTVALAEPVLRTAHRFHSPRLPGPPHCPQRSPPASHPYALLRLLPSIPGHTSPWIETHRRPEASSHRRLGKVVAIPQVGGLHHRYTRRAA